MYRESRVLFCGSCPLHRHTSCPWWIAVPLETKISLRTPEKYQVHVETAAVVSVNQTGGRGSEHDMKTLNLTMRPDERLVDES